MQATKGSFCRSAGRMRIQHPDISVCWGRGNNYLIECHGYYMNIHKVLDEEQTFSDFYNILLETMNMILSVRSRLILLANWHFYDCVRNLHKVFAANGLALFLLIGFHHLFHRMCCLKGSKKKIPLSKISKEKKHFQKFSSRNPHLPGSFPSES